ncbi:MAG: trehalose-phosphatase [Actinobacteria bacterium]|nr:trehalose-phosphatase [Actinomycetota bacterium]
MRISRERIDAVIFDMDGVVTESTGLHTAAWKRTFDGYLREVAERRGQPFQPFTDEDYLRYVDGKPRYDGVASFLEARDIQLPYGDPDDPPERETVCGVGNRKNRAFLELLRDHGAQRYDSTVELIRGLHRAGVRTAVISSSRNATQVLDSAGVRELFEVQVDGTDAMRLDLAGKPDPAIFLEAARRLGVEPGRAAVVEDAQAGVKAGSRGGFALVIGVDRADQRTDLEAHGADVVVDDLQEVGVVPDEDERVAIGELPLAVDRPEDVEAALEGREPAVFLDYDGTLTPIVEDAADATLQDETRAAIRRLAHRCFVAVVSGRDLDDVRSMVGLDELHYAGSHGFEILTPHGERHEHGREFLPALEAAEQDLRGRLSSIDGAVVERKRFAVAVHYRRVSDEHVDQVEAAVDAVVTDQSQLRKAGGKRIFELRPDMDWDKGRALRWLLDELDLDRDDVVPLYVGDDVTDEDAFRELRDRGLALVVRGEDDQRPTAADYALRDPGEVRTFLQQLVDRLEDAQ